MLTIPIEKLVSVLLVFIAIIISFIIAVKSLRSYRQNKQNLTILIAIGSIFIASAMVFLVIEQVFLSTDLPFTDPFLGVYVFGATATILSGCAAAAFAAFAFEMAFPKHTLKLTLIASVIVSFYVISWLLDVKVVIDEEIHFIFMTPFGIPFTPLLSYFTLIPIMSVPIFVLFYYSLKVRKESPVASKRSALLGIGGLCLATAYIVELLGIDEVTTTIFRSLFVVAAILFYIALFKIKKQVE